MVLNVLDGAAVGEAVARAEPEAIIYEATAIPAAINLRKFDQTFGPTNKLRTVGLDHLLAAARAQGVRRFIAQSYAGWPNSRTGVLATAASRAARRSGREKRRQQHGGGRSPARGAGRVG